MNNVPDWKICLEIGLNHLGSETLLEEIVNDSRISDLGVALSIQIKEESFYETNKNLFLTFEQHINFIEKFKLLHIPCGIALGPISNLKKLYDSGVKPDFLKLLSNSSCNPEFMNKVFNLFNCPKYISVGLSDFAYIKKEIIPLMSVNDRLIHTSLSHDSNDQNLSDIKILSDLDVKVFYGLHADDHNLINTSIGAGAEGIFFYIGNKSLNLPDFSHAIDLDDIKKVVLNAESSFSAMKKSKDGSKSIKIDLLG